MSAFSTGHRVVVRCVAGHGCVLPAWDNWFATIIERVDDDRYRIALDCLPEGREWLQTVHACEFGAYQLDLL